MESMICASSLPSLVSICIHVGESMGATALANGQTHARTSITIDGWRLVDQVRKRRLAKKMDSVLAYRPHSYAHNRLWQWMIVILTFLQWTVVTVCRPRVAALMIVKWWLAVGNTREIRTVFQWNTALIHGNSQNNAVLFTWDTLQKAQYLSVKFQLWRTVRMGFERT